MRYFGSKTLEKLIASYSIEFECDHFSCGWGRKKSFFRAKDVAQAQKIPLYCMEDGFLRSIGLGVNGVPPLSLVIDDLGIHFDATQPSRLEQYILENEVFDLLRVDSAIKTIVQHQLTKYNTAHLSLPEHFIAPEQQAILVIDQTFGDQSIQYGLADTARFQQMLDTALADHPDALILLKIHPDVLSGKKKGHFNLSALDERVQVITENYNIYNLFSVVDAVYVVSSQAGFEALMAGKTVHCFGVPWYAGWGLTIDHFVSQQVHLRRGQPRSLQQLFYAAYYRYCQYYHPMDHRPCELEKILRLLCLNLAWKQRLGEPMVALGFSKWKRKFIAEYIGDKSQPLKFIPKVFAPYSTASQWLVWGKKNPAIIQKKTTQGAKIWRMEDGFIRSNGLGANLIRPCSLVLDDRGIYYDATQASRLEDLLNQVQLNAEKIQLTQDLIAFILAEKMTKYNVGDMQNDWLMAPQGRRVILVPGQVEDDASIQLGGTQIKTNLALLQAVRANHPEAWIIYKPHPDVQAKLRTGFIHPDVVSRFADQMIDNVSMASCLELVDEVHTMTSLTGFEALLRGKQVYCYGLPFYAGWGLTVDQDRCLRRKRKLSLFELVYTVLADYAVYNVPNLPQGMSFVEVDDVIEYLKNAQGINPKINSVKAVVAQFRAQVLKRIKS